MANRMFRKLALFSSTALMTATMAQAQDDAAPLPQATEQTEPEIVVTGTQIQGAQINDVLPVTVLDEQQVENTGASSGDELFRAIPQNGTVAFNEQNATTQNNVRGDVGSVNLRDLGTGNCVLQRLTTQMLGDRFDNNLRVDLRQRRLSRKRFRLADPRVRMQYLALQVGKIDRIAIGQCELPDARGSEIKRRWRTQTADTDDQHPRCRNPRLPGDADFIEQQVTAVTTHRYSRHISGVVS